MKKRVIITSVVAFVLLLAVVAAGLNAVFTVTLVSPTFQTVSEEGRAESLELEEKLSVFKGKSTTFLNLDDVRAVVEEYPCFRVDDVKKKFPGTVELTVSERKEAFAFEGQAGGFFVFDEEGYCMFANRADASNRRTGGENILLEGFALTAEVGKVAEGAYFDELISVFSVFSRQLTQMRANVRSVALHRMGSNPNQSADRFDIVTREGVLIRIMNPSVMPLEKAQAAVNTYLALSDIQKIYGCVTVVNTREGEISADYSSAVPD